MNDAEYIGLDVHYATISVAVLDSAAKLGDGNHPCNEKLRRSSSFSMDWAAVCT